MDSERGIKVKRYKVRMKKRRFKSHIPAVIVGGLRWNKMEELEVLTRSQSETGSPELCVLKRRDCTTCYQSQTVTTGCVTLDTSPRKSLSVAPTSSFWPLVFYFATGNKVRL